MAPAEDVVALDAASASGRRRGQREPVSWGTMFCFGSRRERRTVPVDGDLVPGAADRDVMRSGAGGKETRKGPPLQGCCFLIPARPPGRRKHGTMDSGSGRSTHDKQHQLEHTKQQQEQPRSPSEQPVPWQTQATAGSLSRRAERPRGAGAPAETRSTRSSGNEEPSKGVGAFGPVVGLFVVAAVSMAGLLGGRVWAVACVCAWLAALSGLRRREAGAAGSDGGEAAAVHVDSTDYKKPVVVRMLLERDRTGAVMKAQIN